MESLEEDLRDEIRQLRIELGLAELVYCGEEEQQELAQMLLEGKKLPDDIIIDEYGDFTRYVDNNLSEKEENQLLMYRNIELSRSSQEDLSIIKGCMIFFVVLTIITLVLAIMQWL